MKMKCVCSFAILSILLIQITGGLPNNDEESVDYYVKILRKIIKDIDLEILSFFEWTDQTFTNVATESLSKLKEMRQKFENRVDTLHNVTVHWLEIAKNLSVNVDSCIKNAKTDIEEAKDQFKENEKICMLAGYQETKNEIREIKKSFDEDLQNLYVASNKLDECLALPLEQLICVVNDMMELVYKESNFGDKIEKGNERVNKLATKVLESLKKCVTTNEVLSEQEVEQISSSIVECIKDEIDEHNTPVNV